MMRVHLVTVVRGRHDHLRRQLDHVAAMDPPPAGHVVVSLGDPAVPDVVAAAGGGTLLAHLPVDGPLPLAAGRNHGVARAAEAGADAVVLLDVDCLPEPRLAAEHAEALAAVAGSGPAVVSGRVRYLPAGLSEAEYTPDRLAEVGTDHPARVVPRHGPVAGDVDLLWTLNVSTTVADFRLVGGFDERYTGYGGEDTDFGRRLAAAGGTMWWTAGAGAFHQHHPVSDPPVEHAADIARNATLFRRTWGADAMTGWLTRLEEVGAVRRTPDGWAAT